MDFTCIFFGTLFTIAGIVLACRKGLANLPAWKNMSQQEKEKINIVLLCRNIGGIISLSGIVFLAKGLLSGFSNRCFVIAMIVWLVVAGVDVWYIGKSKRYMSK